MRRRKLIWVASVAGALALAVFVAAGFVHIVSTPDGRTICAKRGWALEFTFVNTTDLVEALQSKPDRALADEIKVAWTLIDCGVMEGPSKRERLMHALEQIVGRRGRVTREGVVGDEIRITLDSDEACKMLRSTLRITNDDMPDDRTVLTCYGKFDEVWRF